MKAKLQRLVFKSLMNKQPPSIIKDIEIIQLFYPLTRQQIVFPIRNSKCNEERVCVWPLTGLMMKVESDLQKGELYESKPDSIEGISFDCQMCCEVSKKCKRFYSDFYYDRKLDYLIKRAKQKYNQDFDSYSQHLIANQSKMDERIKAKILNKFKFSKLYIYQSGEVFLQFNRRVKGTQLTIRVNIFQNTLINYSEKLTFNPSDYKNNFSALKIIQNISQKKTGELLQKGFDIIQGIYTREYKQILQRKIASSIQQEMKIADISMMNNDECFAARLYISQQYRSEGLIQLIVFYPRYNITQRYVNERIRMAIKRSQRSRVKLAKLPNRQILLYTEETTLIIKLQAPESSLRKYTGSYQKRPIIIKNQLGIIRSQSNQRNNFQYFTLSQKYDNIKKFQHIFDSIRPTIQSPIIIVAPWNQRQIFLVSGTIQGIKNTKVYKITYPNQQSESIVWIDQKTDLNLPYDAIVPIIERERLFLLAYRKQENEYHMIIVQLQSKDNCLQIKQQFDLKTKIPVAHLYPLRETKNSYLLVDLKGEEKALRLNLQDFYLTQIPNFKNQYIKDTFRNKNINSIIQSFPSCSTNSNQINYNIVTSCIITPTYKILYGCSDQWLSSDIGQTLMND